MLYIWFAAIVAIASALEAQPSVCHQASVQCTASSDLAQVSAYCSSRLHVSTSTVTAARTTVTEQVTCNLPPSSLATVFKRGAPAVTERPPSPSCFGQGAQVSSCNCFSFSTRTTTTHLATATARGLFAVGVDAEGYSGLQGYLGGREGGPYQLLFEDKNPYNAQLLQLDPNGHLVSNGTGDERYQAFIHQGPEHVEEPVYFVQGALPNTTDRLITCSLHDNTCRLVCKYEQFDIDRLCEGYLAINAHKNAGKPGRCREAHFFVDPYPNGPNK